MRPAHPRLSCLRPPAIVRAGPRGLALVLAALMPPGCAHPPEPAPLARVRIQNLSDFAWRVSLHPAAGPRGEVWTIPPRGERVLSVPAGDYGLDQTLAGAPATPDATGGETIRLEAGRSYTWPLATLLSEPEEPAP